MKYTINYDDEQRQELIDRISYVLNETGAYKELHKLLVDREEVILHSDMENLADELEEFIFNWTKIEDND
jgi:Fic family protein